MRQVKGYIEKLAAEEKRPKARYAGVSTDGKVLIFVRFVDGRWQTDRPLEVSTRTVEILLQYLAALTVEKPLTGENLLRDFGGGTDIATGLVRAFYGLVTEDRDDRARAIFRQWSENFSEACDYEAGVAHAKKTALQNAAALFGLEVKTPEPFPLYYSIHTYFALLVKLLAAQLVSIYRYKKAGNIAREMVGLRGEALRERLVDLESGGYFERLGIKNFLEADFFSWYLDRWNGGLAENVSALAGELYRYDFPGTETQPDEYRDILQSVYQDLMPRALRHNLGEYYTPDWLVERILNQLGYEGDPRVRILDPACGSGTFLYHEIRRLRNKGRADLADEPYLLEAALNNVVGFDLNPVAVTTARTSYLLALGELLDAYVGEVNIPVFTADSIMTPFAGTELQRADAHVVDTTVGQFILPKNLGGIGEVSRLMDLASLHVRNRLDASSFGAKVRDGFPALAEKDLNYVRGTYERLLTLEAEGKNGIWCAIVKNAFAPVFAQPFDLIAGNPPWINWEHLPENYRRKTYDVWAEYKLFAAKGYEKVLGHAKDDISALMTYVAIDKYLKKDGNLGFVINQSLFKSGKAGMGFRRFRVGVAEKIKVLQVDDMVELKPFPGAKGNYTAVMILQKGNATTYPVSYTFWKKKVTGKRRSPLRPDMTLAEVEALTSRYNWYAQPVAADEPTSAWMTASKATLKAVAKVLGKSGYDAHAGVYTGGANGVFWLEVLETRRDGLIVVRNIAEAGDRPVPQISGILEPDLVYPLVRHADVNRWFASPSVNILVTHLPGKKLNAISEEVMKADYPHSYAWLKHFEGALRERAAYNRYHKRDAPFYSMYDIGDYTFANYHAIWPRMVRYIDAAYIKKVERSIITQETVSILPTNIEEEAHFLVAVLNSKVFNLGFFVSSQVGSKGSGSPGIIKNIRLIKFDKRSPDHAAVAAVSRTAHELALESALEGTASTGLADLEGELNELIAYLYGISKPELKEIKKSLEELTA